MMTGRRLDSSGRTGGPAETVRRFPVLPSTTHASRVARWVDSFPVFGGLVARAVTTGHRVLPFHGSVNGRCASVAPKVNEKHEGGSMKRSLIAALALAPAFAFGIGAGAQSAQANVSLTQISSDPFTNQTSQHATEVEPDTFAFGSTIVASFQQGRFVSGGGASGIGWATSTDAGANWVHDSLPGITKFAGNGPYDRATDPTVAYDAKHGVWLISSLGNHQATGTWDLLVSRSTDGLSWSTPVTVALNPAHGFFDKPWIVCDDSSTSPFYGHCYEQWTDFVGACSQHF